VGACPAKEVLLPPDARHWSDERAAIVLRHELAHVRRRDWLVQLAATIIRSIYWFHPVVWVACAVLRLESERACDDAVLRSGVGGAQYASHLLELARGFLSNPGDPVTAFARRSTLERRVRAMLATGTERSHPGRTHRAAAAVSLLAIALVAAGFGAAPDVASGSFEPGPPKRLTLLLDGRIVDLTKEWPTYPDPQAGLVKGPSLIPFVNP
jgi:beta-lactamase regulating signal transducer with metallopeptidase domain